MFVRVHFIRAGIQVFMRRCSARGEEIERERKGGGGERDKGIEKEREREREKRT